MARLEFHTHDVSESPGRPFSHTWLRNHLQSKQKRQPWAGSSSFLSGPGLHSQATPRGLWSEGGIENRCLPSAYKIYTGNRGDPWRFFQLVEIWRQFPTLTLPGCRPSASSPLEKKSPETFRETGSIWLHHPCSVERNVKRIRETLSKCQTGHCVVGKVDVVSCLGSPCSIKTTQVTLGCVGKAMTVIWTPDLPNFYLANKSNVLLFMFGINTWLKSLKIWLLLPIKERNFSRAMSVWGERIGFPLYLLSASAPDLFYLASSLSRCLNVGILTTQLHFICR